MFHNKRLFPKCLAGLLSVGFLAVAPQLSHAQFGSTSSPNAGQGAQPGVRRATGLLSNPVNYRQMSQVTGVGPISGSVRIYNLFGVLYMQSAFGGAFGSSSFGGTTGGGFGGGFGGGGAVGGTQNSQGLVGSGLVPGIGSTAQGDDAPPGVLLHVNYANLLNPLQSQLNTNNSQNSKGAGGGGIQGGGGGFGGGQSFAFGNGGDGL